MNVPMHLKSVEIELEYLRMQLQLQRHENENLRRSIKMLEISYQSMNTIITNGNVACTLSPYFQVSEVVSAT